MVLLVPRCLDRMMFGSFLYSVYELNHFIKRDAYYNLEERFSHVSGLPEKLKIIISSNRIKRIVLKDVVFQGLVFAYLFIFIKVKYILADKNIITSAKKTVLK